MNEYSSAEYWNKRYEGNCEPFEWYMEWQDISNNLPVDIPKDAQVLHIGCGTSELAKELLKAGVSSVVNIDFSDVCIKEMKLRNPDLSYEVDDAVENHKKYNDATFDLIIDKGCIDSILCCKDYDLKMESLLNGMHRILKNDGKLIIVSVGGPSVRLMHLEGPVWNVEIIKIRKKNADFLLGDEGNPTDKDDEQVDIIEELRHYYIYLCTKKIVSYMFLSFKKYKMCVKNQRIPPKNALKHA